MHVSERIKKANLTPSTVFSKALIHKWSLKANKNWQNLSLPGRRFWYVVFLPSFISRNLKLFHLDLFCDHLFIQDPVAQSPWFCESSRVFYVINLQLNYIVVKKIHGKFSVSLNLLRLLWSNIWSILENASCTDENNVHSISVWWNVL